MEIVLPPYTAVIRTLGKAGDKYQSLLDSLVRQKHPPKKIIVYLAEGHERPKETVGSEEIVFVKKGMVAQRALQYNEVETEWMLFLDDDVFIEPWGMEKMLSDTVKAGADVCAFDAFPHHKFSQKTKLSMALLLSSIPRIGGKERGYRVNFLGTSCYNPNPKTDYAWSTTNAGPAFICKKSDFLKIHFEDDLWLDKAPVAFLEDKVMFYKMHLNGLKILTHYNSGFLHLDAGTSTIAPNIKEKVKRAQYSAAHNGFIFSRLYLRPNINRKQKFIRLLLEPYLWGVNFIYKGFKFLNGKYFPKENKKGIKDAKKYLSTM